MAHSIGKKHPFETQKAIETQKKAAWWANLAKAVAVKYNGRVAGTFRIFLGSIAGKIFRKGPISLMGKTMGLEIWKCGIS